MIRILLILVFLCGSMLAGAPTTTPGTHPIDAEIDRLMKVDESTHGMLQAAAKGYDLWDAELNRVYQELRTALGPADREALKVAQVRWLAFRDSEFNLLETIYARKEGTMWGPLHALDRMKIVKTRACELADRLAMLRES